MGGGTCKKERKWRMFTLDEYYEMRAMLAEAKGLSERIDTLERKKCEAKVVSITGMPQGTSTSDVSSALASIEELKQKYIVALGAIAKEQMRREKMIDKLPVRYREFMRLRYVCGKNWDQIADACYISKRQLFRMHSAVIKGKIRYCQPKPGVRG